MTICKSSESLSTQSCLTLCNPIDCSPPDSSVPRILQTRILELVAIPFSRGYSRPRDGTQSPALKADSLPSEPYVYIYTNEYIWKLSNSNRYSQVN